jgi:hypothetical protein
MRVSFHPPSHVNSVDMVNEKAEHALNPLKLFFFSKAIESCFLLSAPPATGCRRRAGLRRALNKRLNNMQPEAPAGRLMAPAGTHARQDFPEICRRLRRAYSGGLRPAVVFGAKSRQNDSVIVTVSV